MYFLADYILYPLIYYIVRYRVKVVRENLSNSFPDKSEEERRKIERDFYHQFCYLWVEAIWGYFATEEQMQEHVVFHGFEEYVKIAQEHGGVFMMLGHMGCWEIIADFGNRSLPHGIHEYSVYKKQGNETMDKLMQRIRLKRGGIVEKKQLLRHIISHRKDEILCYGMLGDQGPTPVNQHMWTTFLNQETSFLDGSEVLSKKFGFPCIFLTIRRPKRGYYDCTLHPLTGKGHENEDYPITREYAEMLEKNIQEEPHLWLWTHKRWKYKRAQQ